MGLVPDSPEVRPRPWRGRPARSTVGLTPEVEAPPVATSPQGCLRRTTYFPADRSPRARAAPGRKAIDHVLTLRLGRVRRFGHRRRRGDGAGGPARCAETLERLGHGEVGGHGRMNLGEGLLRTRSGWSESTAAVTIVNRRCGLSASRRLRAAPGRPCLRESLPTRRRSSSPFPSRRTARLVWPSRGRQAAAAAVAGRRPAAPDGKPTEPSPQGAGHEHEGHQGQQTPSRRSSRRDGDSSIFMGPAGLGVHHRSGEVAFRWIPGPSPSGLSTMIVSMGVRRLSGRLNPGSHRAGPV